MADVPWTVQTLSRKVVPTVNVPNTTDRYRITNNGRCFLRVNKGTNACNVTIETQSTVDGLAVADRVESVSASSIAYLGPFSTDIYGSSLAVTFSEITGIGVEVLQMP